jgi:Uma2 family endonuclease
VSTKTLMTVEQFAQMHTADTEDYELVDGELIPLSSGTPRHARIRGRVDRLVSGYFDQNPIGEAYAELDCVVAKRTVRRPGLAIFLGERLHEIDLDKIPTPIAPDIAVEVLSLSESAMHVGRKVREYLRAGANEVWILDHANAEVQIHSNANIRRLRESDLLESPLLPGFAAKVSELLG